MQLGQHEIPEIRLHPNCLADIKTIYDAIGADNSTAYDIAVILGYTTNASGAFYRRFNSLIAYGLIARRGRFSVTDLGKRVTYPETEVSRKVALKEAVLHVSLWSELYKKIGNKPRDENFWVQIKNVTGIEAPKAQKVESLIRKWYIEDVSQIDEEVTELRPISLSLDSGKKSMAQQYSGDIPANALGMLSLVGVGNIEINNAETLELAKSALKIIETKLKDQEIEKPKKSEKEIKEEDDFRNRISVS